MERLEDQIVALLAATPHATTEADDDLVDEVQRRMDQVVEAAVEWHQSDEDWLEKSEVLANAIDSLLELRSKSRAQKEVEGK